MAKVVIVGAGFAGHTAALYLGNKIGKKHEITVVSNRDQFGFIPSWVWVGVGHMKPEQTVFALKPVYDRMNVKFVHAAVREIHPDSGDQYVMAERVDSSKENIRLDYDYLVVATGPKLNYAGTPGLGPDDGYTHSICTLPHAVEARDAYFALIERMKKGERVKIVAGTGHPGATCQGAAFEYLGNIHKDLVKKGLRDKADLLWLSNEPALGDFGVRGVQVNQNGTVVNSADFIQAVYESQNIKWQIHTAVQRIEEKKIYWENAAGEYGETEFDFAMLIPQFLGQPLKYIGKNGEDVAEKIVNKAGFVLVDGIYGLDYDTLARNPDAWPSAYQNNNYPNIFAAGIAFAPPGPISKPHTTKNGTLIAPAPPRTGMVSGVIGRVVGLNIIDMIQQGRMAHHDRMSEMVAACIASMGSSLWDGEAVSIVMYPVVPNMKRFPTESGRDHFVSFMEMGLAGAWMKFMLHYTFIWKFRGLPGWNIIPE